MRFVRSHRLPTLRAVAAVTALFLCGTAAEIVPVGSVLGLGAVTFAFLTMPRGMGAATAIGAVLAIGAAAGATSGALVAYFERATKSIQTPRNEDADERRGCLITNTVIELGRSDKDVAEIIDRYFARVERAFCDLIKRSQKNGSIRDDLDPKATARWLFITAQGMSVSARFGRSFSGLPEIVRAALAPASA